MEKKHDFIRLHVPPKVVRLWNQTHACNSEGYAIPNYEELSPPRIKYLREKSHERYKKTEDGKYLESLQFTGEVGRIESFRLYNPEALE